MPGSATAPGRGALALARPCVLPSAFRTASAPGVVKRSRLNGWPARSPADASPTPSRMPAHGSGPMRIATPSSQGTSTPYSLPVSRHTQDPLQRPAGSDPASDDSRVAVQMVTVWLQGLADGRSSTLNRHNRQNAARETGLRANRIVATAVSTRSTSASWRATCRSSSDSWPPRTRRAGSSRTSIRGRPTSLACGYSWRPVSGAARPRADRRRNPRLKQGCPPLPSAQTSASLARGGRKSRARGRRACW